MPEVSARLRGTERAIQHLVGENASQGARLQARAKLDWGRVQHALKPQFKPGTRFPDVSSFQPNVDWRAVHGAKSIGVGSFAVTKISEGAAWTDPFGALRWRKMAAFHMTRGGYHFARPSVSPGEQATHFLSALHAHSVVPRESDVVVFDLEVTDGASASSVRACAAEWAAAVRKQVPCKVWLYGGGPFLRASSVPLTGYDAHWLAAYVGNPAPFMIYGRGHTVAWQYTDGKFGPGPHVCPGIGSGDLSIVL